MKKIIDAYIAKIDELIGTLAPMQKADTMFVKVRALTDEMREEAEKCGDEMLYPTLYNAAATIMMAPEGCSVKQLKEALEDAKTEMEVMKEYF